MRYLYDTNILLSNYNFYEQSQKFFISSITIDELEEIKTASYKDQLIKYKARKVVKWLINHQDKYEIILYNNFNLIQNEQESNDKKIISTGLFLQQKYNITFLTLDLNCFLLAKSVGLKTQIPQQKEKQIPYDGYIKINCKTDQELAKVYEEIYSNTLEIKLYENEYILLYYDDNLIDKYKYKHNKIERVEYLTLYSKMFGRVKPIDPYQELAIDSFKNNKLTLIKGAAGTGKSLLSLAYLFKILEEGFIDKIIIFCNTVATAGSARLGYYPGKRIQKLLDSQIGNFLISKLGAKEQVQRLIDNDQLILLPMSDIRGFDTSGMKAGIYITQAQNLNIDLMKLALQRVGEDSICILDGDNLTQVDLNLYAGMNNGLKRVSEVFRGEPFFGQVTLQIIHRSQIANIANKM